VAVGAGVVVGMTVASDVAVGAGVFVGTSVASGVAVAAAVAVGITVGVRRLSGRDSLLKLWRPD
ncbi:MAG: hypothetical protein CYG59_02005, partial [Chloroflexi bacterium]